LITTAPATPHHQTLTAVKKLEYIDVLRAVAILMVILVHTSQTMNGLSTPIKAIADYGQIGVQLFFVASAYTLCFSQVQRRQENQQLIAFFIRRFFRIAPLYYFAIAWYFLIDPVTNILKIINITNAQYNFNSILANILFVHGFIPSAHNNIVPGGWSIGTEMAFYAVFPLLFSLFSEAQQKWGMISLYILTVTFILLNIMAQLIIWQSPFPEFINDPFVYRNLINQLPIFLLGMTIFFRHQNNLYLQWPLFIQVAIFAMLTIALELLFTTKESWALLLVTVGSGISFALLLNIFRELNYSNKFLEEIGRVSYSMYIFHFGFVWYLIPGLKMTLESFIEPHLLFLLSFILAVGSTFLVAKFSYKYIECPGMLLGKFLVGKIQQATFGA
jgi:peptidoglycan/LPS O-acetylase OafA/YrhL